MDFLIRTIDFTAAGREIVRDRLVSADSLAVEQERTLAELEDQVVENTEQVRGVLRLTGVSMASPKNMPARDASTGEQKAMLIAITLAHAGPPPVLPPAPRTAAIPDVAPRTDDVVRASRSSRRRCLSPSEAVRSLTATRRPRPRW